MNTLYLFDVDGSMTNPRQAMTNEFRDRFLDWIGDKHIATVSGGTIEHLKEQIPDDITNKLEFIFACSGNDVYKRSLDEMENIQRNEFPKDDIALTTFLTFELKHCNCPLLKGKVNFEYRPGLLNFSVVGRDSSQEVRDAYQVWDKMDGERERIVSYINSKFPQYHASIGGQISVDIVERGNHKGQVLDFINLTEYKIKFYGDRVLAGNDKPLADRIAQLGCGSSYNVSGPADLLSKLGA